MIRWYKQIMLVWSLEKELYLESLIKAQGYANSVVMIGMESENITVVVEDDNFTTDDAISIYTVLLEEVNASPEEVRIIPLSWFLIKNIRKSLKTLSFKLKICYTYIV